MSLRRRFTLLCAAFLGLAIAGSAGEAAFFLRARDASREHARLTEAVVLAGDLRTSLVTQAASIRAYFLDANTSSYDEFTRARLKAADLTGQLQGLVPPGGRLAREIEAVTHDALAWRTDSMNPLIALEQQGAYQQVIEQYSAGQAVPLFQAVTRSVRSLQRELTATERTVEHRADATRLNAIEYGAGFVVAIALAFSFIRIVASAWLVQPINNLAHTMRSSDALDELPGSRGPTELRDLALSSEALRTRLHEELNEAARTRATLGQHSSVLLSLRGRSELASNRLPPGWDYCAQLVPTPGVVAGDCYDISSTGDAITIIIVDAIDQGEAAAFAGLRAKELLRAGLRMHGDLGAGVAWASAQMPEALGPGVTALVARVSYGTGALAYASAGHPEALLCDGVRSERLPATGPEFGTPDGVWSVTTIPMQPGQVLVAYTDGLFAGRTESHGRFGLERLGHVVRDNYGDSCEVIAKQVLTEAGAFVPGRAHDDVIVTVLARAMPM